MLRSSCELANLGDDDINIFQLNILDYYRDRPVSLHKSSFMYFGSWYVKTPQPKKKDDRIFCLTHNVWFRRRGKFAVVRYPKFSFGSEEYYYSMLLLLLPHRNENDLLAGFNSAKKAFEAKECLFDTSVTFMFTSIASEIENAVRRIRISEQELTAMQNGLFDGNEQIDIVSNISSFCFPNDSNSNLTTEDIQMYETENTVSDCVTREFHELECCNISMDHFKEKFALLRSCQRDVLQQIMLKFQTFSSDRQSFHYFITGGAGTGKSFVVNMIVAYLQLFTSHQPGCSPVVVYAPTGTAARNIRGSTIHNLLKIPVNKYLGPYLNVCCPDYNVSLTHLPLSSLMRLV